MIGKASWTGTQAITTAFASVTLTPDDAARMSGLVKLGGLWVFGTTLVTAVSLTMRITRDSVGDELITPDYAATIQAGKTTATDISAIVDFSQIPFFGSTAFYLWAKTDAGTLTLTEARLTYGS